MNELDMEGQASFIAKEHLGALKAIGIDASELDGEDLRAEHGVCGYPCILLGLL